MPTRSRFINPAIALALLVMCSVIANYAVGWACIIATRSEVQSQQLSNVLSRLPGMRSVGTPKHVWPCDVPPHWPSAAFSLREVNLPTVQERVLSASIAVGADAEWPRDDVYATERQAGWPYRSLRGVRCRVILDRSNDDRPARAPVNSYWILELPKFASSRTGVDWLPIGVQPEPFLTNTLVYTATFATLWFTPLALTRLIRRRKGRCPTCNYDRTGLAATTPCPECGTTPAPR